MEKSNILKCGCSCHNFNEKYCYSCLCDYDNLPNKSNTVKIEVLEN